MRTNHQFTTWSLVPNSILAIATSPYFWRSNFLIINPLCVTLLNSSRVEVARPFFFYVTTISSLSLTSAHQISYLLSSEMFVLTFFIIPHNQIFNPVAILPVIAFTRNLLKNFFSHFYKNVGKVDFRIFCPADFFAPFWRFVPYHILHKPT